MSTIRSIKVAFCLFSLVFFSCTEHPKKTEKAVPSAELTEQALIKTNKYLVRSEEENINDFLRRYQWKMQSSGTGLRYLIETDNTGRKAEYGDIVALEYTAKLLNGEIVKSSATHGMLKFCVGKGGVESGLEEGVKMLREGDRAKFIVPSHLAFGLLGDGKTIPPKATLVYEVKLLEIGDAH